MHFCFTLIPQHPPPTVVPYYKNQKTENPREKDIYTALILCVFHCTFGGAGVVRALDLFFVFFILFPPHTLPRQGFRLVRTVRNSLPSIRREQVTKKRARPLPLPWLEWDTYKESSGLPLYNHMGGILKGLFLGRLYQAYFPSLSSYSTPPSINSYLLLPTHFPFHLQEK